MVDLPVKNMVEGELVERLLEKEAERAEQWRIRREAEASRDTALASLSSECAAHAETKSRLSEALRALAMLPEPGESVMLLDEDKIYVRVGELRSARRVLLSIVPNHLATHNP